MIELTESTSWRVSTIKRTQIRQIATPVPSRNLESFDVANFFLRLLCRGHDDEVLDVCFDLTGQYIATASADGTSTWYRKV